MKKPNCEAAYPLAKAGKWDSATAHCAYGANGVKNVDFNIVGSAFKAGPLNTSDEGKCAWSKTMCDDADNMKNFNLCSFKFPLAKTTVADGACYYGTVAADVTTACTWDLCSKDDATLANANCKTNKAKFITGAEKVHKDAADCAFNGTCTWAICQATAESKKWANCSSRCLTDPTTTGCFNPKDATAKCLFAGKGCTYDICKAHDVETATVVGDKPTNPTKVSDWDTYYYGQRCTWEETQNLRLTVPHDTRANWTSVTKADNAALKTA